MSKVIFLAGHKGMVGSAIFRQLKGLPDCKIITKSRKELDLTDTEEVKKFFSMHEIHEVYMAAAKVGGIHANFSYPADFLYENLMIQNNVIHQSFQSGVKKLLFLGSSCIYPKEAKQPMKENELLSGRLEPTNEPYALAKIAGIKLCESYNRQHKVDYRSIMPTNLYGPGDNFNLSNSHVLPALIKKFHDAKIENIKEVCVWGSGKPRREFLHVDDLATAAVHIMNLNDEQMKTIAPEMCSHINVGTGKDCTISELAFLIKRIVGYDGNIVFDSTKPDGTQRKLLDISKVAKTGWCFKVGLEDGIKQTYNWYLENLNSLRLG